MNGEQSKNYDSSQHVRGYVNTWPVLTLGPYFWKIPGIWPAIPVKLIEGIFCFNTDSVIAKTIRWYSLEGVGKKSN
jgi:hypothetical protein